MIVVGVDAHKRSHTLAAVDAHTGAVIAQQTIAASDTGHAQALRFTAGLAADEQQEVVWAIEDCRHVAARLERALISAAERVIRVSPTLMGASRRGQRQAGKSDPIDAVAVARAVVRDGVESFPAAHLDHDAMQIRVLADHREQLVAERTRTINRLRWHLVALDPELEAQITRGITRPAQDRIRRRLTRLAQTARVRVARHQLTHIAQLSREIEQLHTELDALTRAHHPQLRQQAGCGPVCAAILIGHTAGAQRFTTDAKFARHAGAAPIPASSGNRQRHRLHRGGDRQLNRALHLIALTRQRTDPRTRDYLTRRRAEGKTQREALRALKRHLARHIWRQLYQPPPPTQTTLAQKPQIPQTA